MTGTKEKLSLWDRLRVDQPEALVYETYFQEPFWSLEEFACLVAGITPRNFKKIIENGETVPLSDIAKADRANKVVALFIKKTKKDEPELYALSKSDWHMSPWKFVRWLAINEIGIHRRFMSALPHDLLELFLEFTAENTALRARTKNNREYHRALYRQYANLMLEIYGKELSPGEIYNLPRMQKLLYQIRKWGGRYKKRTITDSWLKDIGEKRERGRPTKKPTS